HRLPIQIEPAGDLGDRRPLLPIQPVNLPPAIFLDHASLLEGPPLADHGRMADLNNSLFHPAPPWVAGGEFSMPITGEFCMPDDSRRERCCGRSFAAWKKGSWSWITWGSTCGWPETRIEPRHSSRRLASSKRGPRPSMKRCCIMRA